MAEAAPGVGAAPASPWPASATFDDGVGLRVGGVPAVELAERFATPLLVLDEAEIRARMRTVRELFPRAAYAVKAFTAHAVIRLALEEGLDLLCASGGEVEACLRAGTPGARLLLHGNAKSDDELALAVEAGVGLVIADGPDELVRLDEIVRGADRMQPVLLRVIPEVDVDTHEAIATGHELSKFGTPLSEALATARLATELPGLTLAGLHAHAGSQLLTIDPFIEVLDTLLELARDVYDATGVAPSVLDVGGGFGVAYTDERPLEPALLSQALRDRLERVASPGIGVPQLLVEPGRWLIANAGVTLYRVLARKRVGATRSLVAVDGGMSDNLRPMLYDAAYTVAPAGPARHAGAETDAEIVTVVGRHCESGDVLAREVSLPWRVEPGELLAVAAAGAYGYSLASSYNRVGRPAVVAVREHRAVPWLRREGAGDLDRLEIGVGRVEADRAAPPSGVEVRPARPSDARSYASMWHAVVAEGRWVRTEHANRSSGSYRRRFRRSWGSESADLVAVEGGRVIGQLGVSREAHHATRHVATLGMAVAADRRGSGIGSALLSAAIHWARDVGVRRLVLSVYPSNTRAIVLYRKFGFVEEGRLSRHSRKSYGYEDEILMARWVGEDE